MRHHHHIHYHDVVVYCPDDNCVIDHNIHPSCHNNDCPVNNNDPATH